MNDPISVTSREGVTLITLQSAPINALGGEMRAALWKTFETLPARDTAVVLIGADEMFCGGVDLRELEPQDGVPGFADLMDRIERCSRPVIAALHGRATGGGLELALACHYRVAAQGTYIGQPEVTLGFPPAGGATQRLPRLIGVERALKVLVSGGLVPDSHPMLQGLIDARAPADLEAFAIGFAKDIAQKDAPPRRTRDMRETLLDGKANQAAISKYRKAYERAPVHAPMRVIECVEAALLLPFEAGIAFELSAFEECLASEQSRALRHMVRAERMARQLPEAQGLAARSIRNVAVTGSGKRAVDLTTTLLKAGLEITAVSPSGTTLHELVDTWFAAALEADQLSEPQVQQARSRFHGPVPPEALRDIDVIFKTDGNAGAADLELERPAETILAVARGAADLRKETDGATVLGLGFGVSLAGSDLMILGKGPQTSEETLLALSHLALRLNKQTVISNDSRIDLAVWMLGIWRMAAETCLRDGATPYQVDAAMRAMGCRMGPYQLLDLAGLESLAARMPARIIPSKPLPGFIEALRDAGQAGRSAREGVYLYDKDHPKGAEDPAIVELTRQLRERHGLPERSISDRAIQRRCLIALANEAARLRTEGIVRRASDIDVVMHHGLGFPRWRGGPVFQADEGGLLALRRDLRRLADYDPYIWEPAPLLSELIKNGITLSEA